MHFLSRRTFPRSPVASSSSTRSGGSFARSTDGEEEGGRSGPGKEREGGKGGRRDGGGRKDGRPSERAKKRGSLLNVALLCYPRSASFSPPGTFFLPSVSAWVEKRTKGALERLSPFPLHPSPPSPGFTCCAWKKKKKGRSPHFVFVILTSLTYLLRSP